MCCMEDCYSRGICYNLDEYDGSISNESKLEKIKFYCITHIPESKVNVIDSSEKDNISEIDNIINHIISIYEIVVIKTGLGDVIMRIYECCNNFCENYSLQV